jgi:predicted TPR repeat methyltransferase
MSAPSRAPRLGPDRFERIYAESFDPWRYATSGYEHAKYAATLAAIGDGAVGRALEVGCSIGVFTELLSRRCDRVLAIDFSERALALARERLDGVTNVELRRASFPEELPAEDWDLIVCSEILCYLDEPTFRAATRWLEAKLRRGAMVLAVSWTGRGTVEPMKGDDAHDMLVAELERWHAADARRPGYRLDRFDGGPSIQ